MQLRADPVIVALVLEKHSLEPIEARVPGELDLKRIAPGIAAIATAVVADPHIVDTAVTHQRGWLGGIP